MSVIPIILMDGLLFASWLFLISVGLTLIFGVLRILNMAHGSLYALGAYAGASLVIAYLNSDLWPYGTYALLLIAAVLVGVIVGPILERGLLRRIYGKDPNLQLLLTFALFLVLEDATKLIFGVRPLYAAKPYSLLGFVEFANIRYSLYSFLLLGVAVVSGLLLWWFMNKTNYGRTLIAVIHDPEISSSLGINVPKTFMFAFALGTFLAALGGAFSAPMIAVLPGMAAEVIILAFAVVSIGGLGSLEGAALGALMVGVVRAAMIHLFPVLDLFTIYFVMALVLIFRPQGLFVKEEIRRI
jgi:branched-chain amino acid transport system permease protein